MRRITRAFLRHNHVEGSETDDAVLAVSELVSNGIQHANGDLELRVHCFGGGLRIEVSDGSRDPAEMRLAAPDDESGRGLFLVNALTTEWGVSDDGTTTWCELRWTQC